jgi:protein TonB
MLALFIIMGIIAGYSIIEYYASKNWQFITSETRNEAVFENRNKSYGAYEIRKNYNNRIILIMIGFIVGIGGISATTIAYVRTMKVAPAKTTELTTIIKLIPEDVKPIPEKKVEPTKTLPTENPETIVTEGTAGNPATTFTFVEPIVKQTGEENPMIGDQTIPAGTSTVIGGTPFGIPGGTSDSVSVTRVGTTNVEPTTFPEVVAEFPGGINAMRKYVERTIDLSGISGGAKVYMRFVVDTDGSMSGIRVASKKGDCEGCEAAAIDVIRSMPKWKPGKINGEPVKSYYNFPITIKNDY